MSVRANQSDIEKIEVYAQKRPQALEEVSVAVSYIDGEILKDQHFKDSTEIAFFTPNLKISQNAAEGTPPAVNIRGIGLVDYNTANTSPIAMYVDDIAVGSANNQIVNLFDIEQIDVLRGPQGSLFGRNSTGGALLIRSKRPAFSQSGYLTLGAANNNAKSVDGMYNFVINENNAVRFAVNYQDYEYSSYNLDPNSPTAYMEQTNARLSWLGDYDDFEVYVKANLQDWQGIVQPVGSIGVIANPATAERCTAEQAGSQNCYDSFGFNDGNDDFYAVRVNNDSPHETDGKGFSAQMRWQLSQDTELTSLTGYNDLQRTHAFNCDGSPARLCEGQLGLDTQLVSQELRLTTQFDEHTLVTGLYYADEKIDQNNKNDLLRDYRGILPSNVTATFYYDNTIKTNNAAAFMQLDYAMSQQWLITAGLRYEYESLFYDSKADLNTIVDPSNLEGIYVPFYEVSDDTSDNGVSGQLAVNYQYSTHTHLYYRFANGSKSGGYNGGYLSSPEQAALAAYGKERLNAHEIGSKSWWAEQKVRLNWAAFYYDYNDQQVFMNQASESPQMPPLQLLENVADSIIYGTEVELDYQPSEALALRFAAGYIPHAEFEEYVDPLGNSLTNKRLPFTSKWNLSAAISYQANIADHPLTSALMVDYQSDYYFDQNMNPYAKQDAYSLVNGHLKYQMDNWAFTLWGKNLFDTHYSHLKFDLTEFLGMLEDFKGEGRRYGLDISYEF